MSRKREFPIDALPPMLWNAVLDARTATGAPIALIVGSALTALSAAIQGIYDVERPGGMKGPVSLYIITLAESGERKTSADKILLRSIREQEKAQKEKFCERMTRYRAEHDYWCHQVRGLKRAIEKKATQGFFQDQSVERQLTDLYANEPVKPRLVRLIYEDASSAALKAGLADWPSAAILSDEAVKVLDGMIFREIGVINGLWGGSELIVDRVTSAMPPVMNPRLTIGAMIQPGAFKKILEKRGDEMRDIGLFARFLISYPASTQGSRYMAGSEPSRAGLEAFHDRLKVLLNENNLDENQALKDKKIIQFTKAASDKWIAMVNDIERAVRPGGEFESMNVYSHLKLTGSVLGANQQYVIKP